MTNMDYCKFENTARDLSQCLDNWTLEEDATDYEKDGKERIIELAREIVRMEKEK